MPIYPYKCSHCGNQTELWGSFDHATPICCDEAMERIYEMRVFKIKQGEELWLHRMDDIHKAQAQRGERLRFVHPREIQAT